MNLTDLRARYSVTDEPLRSERRLEMAVLLLVALVLLQMLWLLVSYLLPSHVDAIPPAPDSMAVETIAGAGTLTSAQSRDIRARPVFWESRRPLDPLPPAVAETDVNEADAPAAEKVLRGLSLSGIVANDDESRVIVTFEGKQQRLAPGEDIAGWTLRSVRPDEAVFEDSGREVVVRLRPRPVIAAAESAEGTGAGNDGADADRAADVLRGLLDSAQEQTGSESEEEPRLSLGG